MNVVGIAQMATSMQQYKLLQEASVRVLKTAMDFNNNLTLEIIQRMSQPSENLQSNNPMGTGVFLNIRV